MKKSEQTSKKVASEAGQLLKKRFRTRRFDGVLHNLVSLSEMEKIRSVLASALTQTADRKTYRAYMLTTALEKNQAKEISKLRRRLEMNHVWVLRNGKMHRRRLEPGEYVPDGIACRDETIKQQDQYINELRIRIGLKPRKKPLSDDLGFDPRDGGKIGRQHVPKQPLYVDGILNIPGPNLRSKAKVKNKSPRKNKQFNRSDFYPSSRPPRNSP